MVFRNLPNRLMGKNSFLRLRDGLKTGLLFSDKPATPLTVQAAIEQEVKDLSQNVENFFTYEEIFQDFVEVIYISSFSFELSKYNKNYVITKAYVNF
jgi:hypothetical protein